MFVFNDCKQFNCSVLGIFLDLPDTSINLLLVAVIVNLAKVMVCHAKTPLMQKGVAK